MRYLPGIIAFFVCAGTLPLVAQLARHWDIYDSPGPLKIHHGSVPRLGGLAMMAGLLASSVLFLPRTSMLTALPISVFAAVWAVGLVDDMKTLPSYARFCVHITAGAAFWFAGWRPEWFRISALDLIATCLFVALVINGMNLLDGMDGLAAGTGAIVSVGFVAISVKDSSFIGFVLASTLLGACIGMLTVNFPPATMFMGDSGSTLIGIVFAFLSLNWVRTQGEGHRIIVPLIFLTVPLADLILAILRRARARTALFAGDRRHFYDILLQHGWTVRRVLEVSLGATAVLVCIGWFSSNHSFAQVFSAVIVFSSVAEIAYLIGSLKSEPKRTPIRRRETSFGPTFE